MNVDEHFRKSYAENYNTFAGRCLTPDDSSSNGSPIEQTPGEFSSVMIYLLISSNFFSSRFN